MVSLLHVLVGSGLCGQTLPRGSLSLGWQWSVRSAPSVKIPPGIHLSFAVLRSFANAGSQFRGIPTHVMNPKAFTEGAKLLIS